MVENEQSFGEYLRQLIKDSGITQHKFYTELGIRKPYFYDILAGRTNPDGTLKLICLLDEECGRTGMEPNLIIDNSSLSIHKHSLPKCAGILAGFLYHSRHSGNRQ